MYREFWWASAMSRMDTRDSLATVIERGVHAYRRTAPPEEVTTFNLVRRLAFWHARMGFDYVALHSRPLEGGNRRTGRQPSGADLEMSIEVSPGRWIDLALQAKRLHPASGTYEGWNTTQINHLRRWANAHGGRTPGMLLYNAALAPFGPPGTFGIPMGACCSGPVRCHGWRWPRWMPPDDRTPAAVTLVILDPEGVAPAAGSPSTLNNPTPGQVMPWMQPLECLFCPSAANSTHPSKIAASTRPPDWAQSLLATSPPVDDLGVAETAPADEDLLDLAAFSLVMTHPDSQRLPDQERQFGES